MSHARGLWQQGYPDLLTTAVLSIMGRSMSETRYEASAGKPAEAIFSAIKPLPVAELEAMSKRLRRDIITMIAAAGSGHPGGSLSAVEIVTALYFHILRHNRVDCKWAERDRFILSKGHAAPLLYAALAECGYLPVAELNTLRQIDSRLQGHTECRLVPGIEMSAGALGQGLSFAVGVSLAGRLDKMNYRTYVLMGDGECDEGQVWEAAMAASHFKLVNITAIVDNNGIQLDSFNKDIMNLEPFCAKWEAFGWNVVEVDGHSFVQLIGAFNQARDIKAKPTVIIAHTVKGKGVSFMENNPEWHGKAPSAEEQKRALQELS